MHSFPFPSLVNSSSLTRNMYSFPFPFVLILFVVYQLRIYVLSYSTFLFLFLNLSAVSSSTDERPLLFPPLYACDSSVRSVYHPSFNPCICVCMDWQSRLSYDEPFTIYTQKNESGLHHLPLISGQSKSSTETESSSTHTFHFATLAPFIFLIARTTTKFN